MINRITLLGRIGKKDYKITRNGSKLCTLNIATNKRYLDANGQQKEITNWHAVYFFDKLGEIADKYAHVGHLVYVEGEMNNKKIVEEDGKNRHFQMITGNHIQVIPTGRKDDKPASSQTEESTENYYMHNNDDSVPY